MKVAKLVKVSLMTRVIVDETATERDILESCQGKFIEKIEYELSENLEEIVLDEECPYDPEFDGEEEPFEVAQPRMHIGDNDYCSTCGENVTGEQHTCDKSEEVYQQMKHEYVKSDVTSGEFYVYVKISVAYTENEVRKGIQRFLDWDESEAKFDLKKNKKYWKIIDK
jgi:hypothetical protein